MRTLSNGILELEVSERGAEMQSLRKVSSNREYIWNANPDYWAKHAPLLFPIIGKPNHEGVVFDGINYPIGKHGFIQQMNFSCTEGDRILEFRADDNEDTRKLFPYAFHLEIIYQLSRNKVFQRFRVQYTGAEGVMPFQIGSHPAFFLPKFKEEDEIHGYLSFNDVQEIHSNEIDSNGHYTDKVAVIALDEKGMLPLKNDTFDCDTILETRGIINRTSLYDKDRKPVLTIKANTPSIAYWSPSGKNAPFVCLEPWFGCCPKSGTSDVLAEQPMVNLLKPGEIFEGEVEIVIE